MKHQMVFLFIGRLLLVIMTCPLITGVMDGSTDAAEASSSCTRRTRGPTRCVDVHRLPPGQKFHIEVDEMGQPVGEHVSKLSNYLGILARDGSLIPLIHKTWREVSDDAKLSAWQRVQSKFDVDDSLKNFVFRSINKKWKDYKSELKRKYYDPYATNDERFRNSPPSVVEAQWSVLVYHWGEQEAQTLSDRNRNNRAQQTLAHTAGTRSFARVRKEKELSGRAETFIHTHLRKDGSPVSEDAGNKIEQMRNIMAAGTPDGTSCDDIYTQVMGPDAHGRVRCCGMGVTPTKMWGSSSSRQGVDAQELNKLKEQLEEERRLREEQAERSSRDMERANRQIAELQRLFYSFAGQAGQSSGGDDTPHQMPDSPPDHC